MAGQLCYSGCGDTGAMQCPPTATDEYVSLKCPHRPSSFRHQGAVGPGRHAEIRGEALLPCRQDTRRAGQHLNHKAPGGA